MIRTEGRRIMKNNTETKVRIESSFDFNEKVIIKPLKKKIKWGLMYDRHLCPFYEEHGGNYHQGCWEFYDLCWCSPDLGLNPTCYTGCFLIRNNEEAMLDTCLGALNRKVEIGHYKKELITFRDLTEGEKQNIIRDMETFMDVFNKRFDSPSLYK